MLTNLLIASTFIIVTLIVIVNFSRIFEFTGWLTVRIDKIKLLIGTLIRAYKHYRKMMNKPTYQLSPYNYDC